jgi:hypothetical protein
MYFIININNGLAALYWALALFQFLVPIDGGSSVITESFYSLVLCSLSLWLV